MDCDVAIVGAGPAGLATAIAAAQTGLRVVVLDRERLPHDKPCGEGLMAPGLEALVALGVELEGHPIAGIRYVQEDASAVEGRLPRPGLGVRRTALSAAMIERAARAGVEVRERQAVRDHHRAEDRITLTLERGSLNARFLVAADGLHSPIRRREGLERVLPAERFGARQHFALAPWTSHVEIHLAPGAEAYVTPVAPDQLGVAFLFIRGALPRLEDFPHLSAKLAGARATSSLRGAGPFRHAARALTTERLALVGDAAGYVDAITGEGISLGLASGRLLGSLLAQAIADDGRPRALARYLTDWRARYRRYALATSALLALARRPRLRRNVLALLTRQPAVFARLLAWAVDPGSERAAGLLEEAELLGGARPP